ncbi:DUF1048 domain-containing protein [Crossiella cryophila]|uniref:DNA-binding ferritin-like protein (Dps family) n=1 Tax=Crossiella cryophila TaxID=43355 RepID=A0A7W7CDB2_9PSEU|nr:DUF1048 domain-containing protein [Crossiella cryophila]MBB4679005.1 DNA-binding ferritin-like protein (Dps family) [Crossiella cryophila]
MFISKIVDTVIGDKKRWWQYKARVKKLPENYRLAVEGLERYLLHFGTTDGDSLATMFEDLADLFEQAAADGKRVREIVGEDPVEFVEAFLANYTTGGWINRERARLTEAIDRAEQADGGPRP